MIRWPVAYVAAIAAFVAGDLAWLSLMTPVLYRPVMGPLLGDGVRLAPSVAFYLVYLAGVVVLAVAPAARSGGWPRALLLGAVLGVTAYGAYDLTNQAILKVWSTGLTLADMAWGCFNTALASTIGCLVAGTLARR
jgi:uncharacterized membrane protein